MKKSHILIVMSILLILMIGMNSQSDSVKSSDTPKVAINDTVEREPRQMIDNKTVETNISTVEVPPIKEVKNTNTKDELLTQIDSILDNKNGNISIIKDNMSAILQCDECLEKLTLILTSTDIDKDMVREIANAISTANTKESAEFLLKALVSNIELEDSENIDLIQSSFANFNSPEVAILFASVLFEGTDSQIVSSSSLSEGTRYAMGKVINNATDRHYVASDLAQRYMDSDDNEQKDKIANLKYPEMYAMIAVESYDQGNSDAYDLMTQNIFKTDKDESIDAFMILARKTGSDALDDVASLAAKWSQSSTSQRGKEIAEDYLSRSDVTAQERIIATALLSNNTNDNSKQALTKALEHEENNDVFGYIQNAVNQ